MNAGSRIRFMFYSGVTDSYRKVSEGLRERFGIYVSALRLAGCDPFHAKRFEPEPLGGVPGRWLVVQLTPGNYLLLSRPFDGLWVASAIGRFEDVSRWAGAHAVEANLVTGALQCYEKPDEGSGKTTSRGKLFRELSRRDLLTFGVPEPFLPEVLSLDELHGLEALEPKLPPEAGYWLRRYAERGQKPPARKLARRKPVSAATLASSPETRACFVELEPVAEDIDRFASMPLERWRLFQSPEQKALFSSKRMGAFMVTGAAGTGKTVVALYRAKHLISLPDWGKDERLLFTTFSKRLAADIRERLAELIPNPGKLALIEVKNLDGWVGDFLRERGEASRLIYPGSPEWKQVWDRASRIIPRRVGTKNELTRAFYESEFSQVVLSEGITTLDGYLKADRLGRGSTLGKREREAVWSVLGEARRLFGSMRAEALPAQDAFYLARSIVMREHPEGMYRAVVVDEAQDFGNEAFRLLRALVPEAKAQQDGDPPREGDIFLVGDERQQIYRHARNLSACGINVRARRTCRLTDNFRTTAEIHGAALLVYESDVAKARNVESRGWLYTDTESRSRLHGPMPVLYEASGPEDEASWILARIRELFTARNPFRPHEIVVAAYSNEARDHYCEALRALGAEVVPVRAEDNAELARDAVRVSTMHRLKGLEFRAVFIAGADKDKIPSRHALEAVDRTERTEAMRLQRSLFYTAATRARERLFVSSSGEPGDFMRAIERYCRRCDGTFG